MPGKYGSNQAYATFIGPWKRYRADIDASDDAQAPEDVAEVLDLTKSIYGTNSEIWVTAKLKAGNGTVDLNLFMENNGSMAAVQPYVSVATKAALATLTVYKFTGLVAGRYRILATVAEGQTWDLHTATNSI